MQWFFRPKVLLGLAVLIGIGSLFSQNALNFAGMSLISWFVVFQNIQQGRVQKDERFLGNVGKAGYIGFYLANISMTFLFLAIGFLHISAATALYLTAGIFFLMNFGFLAAFFTYER